VEVFSPELVFVRRIPLPVVGGGGPRAVAAIDVGFAMALEVYSPDRIGNTVQILDRNGVITHSVAPGGASTAGAIVPSTIAARQLISDPDGKSFWTTTDTGFVMQRWSSAGELLENYLVTNVPWVKPVVYYDTVVGRAGYPERGIRLARPHSRVYLINVDSEGRLWLESQLPSNGDARNGHPTTRMIHVFDPRSRTFLMSESRAGNFYFLSRDHALSGGSETNGYRTYTVSRVTVLRGESVSSDILPDSQVR
jgi:hypothetical protein